jgi:hypothetical protein
MSQLVFKRKLGRVRDESWEKGGGRYGERAVWGESGDTKCRVSLMILMMLIATIWRQCPRAGLSHAKTAL